MIGFFFNTVMPGAVGGDLVKAIYLIRDQDGRRKTPTMLAILLDRVMGLASLVILAGIAIAFNLPMLCGGTATRTLAIIIVAILTAFVGIVGCVLYPFKDGKDPIKRLLQRKFLRFALIAKVYDSICRFRDKPLIIFWCLGIGLVIQGCYMGLFMYLSWLLTGQSHDLAQFAIIFSIGSILTAIPLAPGGLGIGHIAFDRLYAVFGSNGGANVFNVLILGHLCLNLLGAIPWLCFKTELTGTSEVEADLKWI